MNGQLLFSRVKNNHTVGCEAVTCLGVEAEGLEEEVRDVQLRHRRSRGAPFGVAALGPGRMVDEKRWNLMSSGKVVRLNKARDRNPTMSPAESGRSMEPEGLLRRTSAAAATAWYTTCGP